MPAENSLPDSSRLRFALFSALTILVSAFLLFQVQPLISKSILPWFGGGPAVWTTCMLFFQILLLGGYAYAHWLPAVGTTKRQVTIHVSLLVLAVVLLPITPKETWKPTAGGDPAKQILLLLAANVAVPYFLLSTTGPLVQRWFSRACPGWSPYRLYALSNIGSLAALLSYPFLFEPMFGVSAQGWIWSVGFLVFALLSGGMALYLRFAGVSLDENASDGAPSVVATSTESSDATTNPSLVDKMVWLFLPALSSVAFLAVTDHLCQDVAVVPFLWIAPLALYLLTFIICFDSPRWYIRPLFAATVIVSIAMLSAMMNEWEVTNYLDDEKSPWLNDGLKAAKPWLDWLTSRDVPLNTKIVKTWNDGILSHSGTYLVALFSLCMVCHGELFAARPTAKHLTSYYLMISAGGALGGVLVALVCPQVFSSFAELHLVLAAGAMVALFALLIWMVPREGLSTDELKRVSLWLRLVAVVPLAILLFPIMRGQFAAAKHEGIVHLRNFYGVLRVTEHNENSPESHSRKLLNGRILHGFQYLAEEKRRQPTTYYDKFSGVGLAIDNFPRQSKKRLGCVGLGAGTLATYGESRDFVRFYEINPNVVHVAKEYFSFLSDCPAEVSIALGDARLSLEREESQQFDILALDAFSGDAIPVHLLTREAFALYMRHLKPDGVIAIHVSNLHLELNPIVQRLAEENDYEVVSIENGRDFEDGDATSDWLLVTKNQEFLANPVIVAASRQLEDTHPHVQAWTDQHSNLFQILK